MYNFFSNNQPIDGKYYIDGKDFNHVKNVLRMKVGEKFFVSFSGKSDLCVLESYTETCVIAKIEEENCQNTDLPINVFLFQGLPKSDKLELIIQKSVELGVHAIVPVEMKRCIVKLDAKKKSSKTERYNAISESAAKQSKRSYIPKVYEPISYNECLEMAKNLDVVLVPYECADGMISTKNCLSKIKQGMSVGIIIGPEGGFDDSEIEKVTDLGFDVVSLGKRILRTETAAITSLAMIMLLSEISL